MKSNSNINFTHYQSPNITIEGGVGIGTTNHKFKESNENSMHINYTNNTVNRGRVFRNSVLNINNNSNTILKTKKLDFRTQPSYIESTDLSFNKESYTNTNNNSIIFKRVNSLVAKKLKSKDNKDLRNLSENNANHHNSHIAHNPHNVNLSKENCSFSRNNSSCKTRKRNLTEERQIFEEVSF